MTVVQEAARLDPQERVQQRTVEHAPVPRILEETVEVVRFIPQERVQWIDEQIVEVRNLQVPEHSEQIVDVLVPQDDVLEALQFQVLANSHEIQWKCSDVESGK